MAFDISHNSSFDPAALTRELNLLNRSLVNLVDQSSPNLNLVLEPTVATLDRLLLSQERLKQEIATGNEKLVEQQNIIAGQTAEINRLKQQVNAQGQWLTTNVNWKTLGAMSFCLGMFLTIITS
jgi:hypothetical protein